MTDGCLLHRTSRLQAGACSADRTAKTTQAIYAPTINTTIAWLMIPATREDREESAGALKHHLVRSGRVCSPRPAGADLARLCDSPRRKGVELAREQSVL